MTAKKVSQHLVTKSFFYRLTFPFANAFYGATGAIMYNVTSSESSRSIIHKKLYTNESARLTENLNPRFSFCNHISHRIFYLIWGLRVVVPIIVTMKNSYLGVSFVRAIDHWQKERKRRSLRFLSSVVTTTMDLNRLFVYLKL